MCTFIQVKSRIKDKLFSAFGKSFLSAMFFVFFKQNGFQFDLPVLY